MVAGMATHKNTNDDHGDGDRLDVVHKLGQEGRASIERIHREQSTPNQDRNEQQSGR
jgi:hypothetical protein